MFDYVNGTVGGGKGRGSALGEEGGIGLAPSPNGEKLVV